MLSSTVIPPISPIFAFLMLVVAAVFIAMCVWKFVKASELASESLNRIAQQLGAERVS